MDLADIKDVSIFAEQVGSNFRIEIEPNRYVAATLVEADALGNGSGIVQLGGRQRFSLLFNVFEDVDLPQSIYRVHHESLGEWPLFLVPVGKRQMESVFN